MGQTVQFRVAIVCLIELLKDLVHAVVLVERFEDGYRFWTETY
jgi:hypothetical protein